MGIFDRLFGRQPAAKNTPGTAMTNGSAFPTERPVEKEAIIVNIFSETLTSLGRADSDRKYSQDQKRALAWSSTQYFSRNPTYDPSTSMGRRALRIGERMAEKDGVWREVWAACHLLLSVDAPEIGQSDVAELCLDLGWAHLAMSNTKLASLYLDCARTLASRHPQKGFSWSVTAACLQRYIQQNALEGYHRLLAGVAEQEVAAPQVARILYDRGVKSARWEDAAGKRHNLVAASAQLQASLDLNRRLKNAPAIGILLCELGHVKKLLLYREEARSLYEQSLQVLQPMGMDCTMILDALRSVG